MGRGSTGGMAQVAKKSTGGKGKSKGDSSTEQVIGFPSHLLELLPPYLHPMVDRGLSYIGDASLSSMGCIDFLYVV